MRSQEKIFADGVGFGMAVAVRPNCVPRPGLNRFPFTPGCALGIPVAARPNCVPRPEPNCFPLTPARALGIRSSSSPMRTSSVEDSVLGALLHCVDTIKSPTHGTFVFTVAARRRSSSSPMQMWMLRNAIQSQNFPKNIGRVGCPAEPIRLLRLAAKRGADVSAAVPLLLLWRCLCQRQNSRKRSDRMAV